MTKTFLDKETVERIASLARLTLSEDEVKRFSKELSAVLEAFRVLQKVDTSGISPSFHPINLKERTREDKIEKSLSQREALSNTRNEEEGYFKGPKVV